MFAKLLFAHLVSDFLLQPNALIKWKNRSAWGVFLHAFIVFSISALVLSPYLSVTGVIPVLFLAALLHFVQDNCKIASDRGGKPDFVRHFLLDQLGHLLVVALTALALNRLLADSPIGAPWAYLLAAKGVPIPILPSWYLQDRIFYFCSLFIVFVPAWDIFLFQFQRFRKPMEPYRPAWKKLFWRGFFLISIWVLLDFFFA